MSTLKKQPYQRRVTLKKHNRITGDLKQDIDKLIEELTISKDLIVEKTSHLAASEENYRISSKMVRDLSQSIESLQKELDDKIFYYESDIEELKVRASNLQKESCRYKEDLKNSNKSRKTWRALAIVASTSYIFLSLYLMFS